MIETGRRPVVQGERDLHLTSAQCHEVVPMPSPWVTRALNRALPGKSFDRFAPSERDGEFDLVPDPYVTKLDEVEADGGFAGPWPDDEQEDTGAEG